MTQPIQRICILGGGFGGLYTALKLSQFPWTTPPEILLIDRHDRFVFSPLLYELMTGELQTWEVAPPFAEILQNTGIRFLQAQVERIDLTDRQVYLVGRDPIAYDRLAIALGGETPLDSIAGAAEYALPFRNVSDAYTLQERLRVLEASDRDKIRIAIVGAGYSGVELACKLADRLRSRGRLRIIDRHDTILRTTSEFNRNAAKKALSDRGIWLDLETSVQSVESDAIALEYKGQVDRLSVDVVLWTVGTQVAQVVRQLPLPHNDRGQLLTATTLQIPERSEVFALGDAAECRDEDGQLVPTTAQAAFQQADYVAWNIWASGSTDPASPAGNRPLLPFRYVNLGEMMTLGTENATLAGLGIQIEGPLAHIARRLIYLYRLPTWEHQLKVGFHWMTNPLREWMKT
jgi:demethylphylloquinone reductase